MKMKKRLLFTAIISIAFILPKYGNAQIDEGQLGAWYMYFFSTSFKESQWGVQGDIQYRNWNLGGDLEQVKLGGEIEDVDPEAVMVVINDATETLAQEVHRSFDFFSATSSDEKVQKLYIAGGVSKTPNICKFLENQLAIPVEVLEPFRLISANEKEFDPEYIQAVGPLFSVAVGLAMRRLGDK